MLKAWVAGLWRFFVAPRFVWGIRSRVGFRRNSRYGSSTFIVHRDRLVLGDHVYIGQFCFIDAQAGVEIGEGCQICYWTSILTHSSHIAIRLYGKQYTATKPDLAAYFLKPVKVGPYSFVGPHSILMPGTVLGKGSLVTAYSQVSGEFPDFAIIAGNPARQVGDTRELDAPYLKQHPELRPHYEEWVARL